MQVKILTAAKVLVAMLDVEVDLVSDLGALGGFSGLNREKGSDGDDKEGEEELCVHCSTL